MLDLNGFKTEFISKCRDTLSERGPEGMWIEERSVNKSQRGILNGMVFIQDGLSCAPTLYVEDYYNAYKKGSSITSLSQDAIDAVVRGMSMAGMLSDRTDALIEDTSNLRVRLLNKKLNKEYLKNIPVKDAGCGFVFIAEVEYGDFRAVINQELLSSMNISEEELFETAFNNTVKSYPARLFDLADSITLDNEEHENLLEAPLKRVPAGAGPGLVLTNSRYFWGAGALFYPGVIERIHELLDDEFYVLPSSVHELIIIAADGQDEHRLADTVRSANRAVVSQEDLLADDLFKCESGTLKRISYNGMIPSESEKVC